MKKLNTKIVDNQYAEYYLNNITKKIIQYAKEYEDNTTEWDDEDAIGNCIIREYNERGELLFMESYKDGKQHGLQIYPSDKKNEHGDKIYDHIEYYKGIDLSRLESYQIWNRLNKLDNN